MINYFICILFLMLFVLFLYSFGSSITKNNKSYVYNFIIGYIIYSFFVAVGGCSVQILKLPYVIFICYMTALILLISFVTFKRLKKYNIELFPQGIKGLIKNNWFIIVVVVILMFISLGNIEYFWMGNNLDDGFYLNRVATYAALGNIYNQTPATGLPDHTLLSVYSLNSWEIEASFFVKVLHVDSSVFLRFGMSTFNYFLLSCILVAFCEEIFDNIKIKKENFQYFSAILLIFSFVQPFLYRFVFLQDAWLFNSAVYYGSSVVKIGGIFLLLLPIISRNKIDIHTVIIGFITSVVLISKSTIAIPIIFAVAVGYFISFLLFEKKKNYVLIIGTIVILIILGILLKDNSVINNRVLEQLKLNIKSILLYFSIFMFIIGNIVFKNKKFNTFSIILITFIILLYLNPFNDIIENLSQYVFVTARMQSTLLQSIIIIGFTVIFAFVFSKLKSQIIINAFIAVFVIAITSISLYGYYTISGNILNAYKIIYKNKAILPNSTVNLGNSLEKLYSEKNVEINAMVPEGVDSGDGYTHSLAVLLRTYAPHSKIITATGRYGVKPGNEFSSYFQNYTKDYYNYMTDPTNEEYKQKFKELLETYPINVIITPNKDISENIKDYNFELYDKPCDDYGRYCYYIYYLKR